MRRIALATANRAERGLLDPVINRLREKAKHGEIHFQLVEKHFNDEPWAHYFEGWMTNGTKPDIILIPADRKEMVSLAMRSYYAEIPIFHLWAGIGGTDTWDDLNRRVISSFSYLMMCEDEPAKQRLIKSGEEPWRCLPPDEEIVTPEGMKAISAISIGDLVLTHKGRFRPVTRTFCRHYSGDLIGIKTVGSGSSYGWTTPEHPFFVKSISWHRRRHGSKHPIEHYKLENLLWSTASSLSSPAPRGQPRMLAYPRLMEIRDRKEITLTYKKGNQWARQLSKARTLPLDGRLMRVFGYYLAEGYVYSQHGSKTLCFAFGKSIKEFMLACTVIQDLKELGFAPTMTIRDGCYLVRCHSTSLVDFVVDNFGKLAHGKRIPGWVLLLPYEKLEHLLDAYVKGDGSDYGSYSTATTVSKSLVFGVRAIALKLGYTTSVRVYDKLPRVIRQRDKPSVFRTAWTIGISRGNDSTLRIDGCHQYSAIRETSKRTYTGPVWNLEVEEDNSYCTAFSCLHNCHVTGTTHFDDLEIDESLCPKEPYSLFLINPNPIDPEDTKQTLAKATIAASEALRRKIVWIGSSDPLVNKMPLEGVTFYNNLPRMQFLGLLRNCQLFVSNSSASVYEAPFFYRQVYNPGKRNAKRKFAGDLKPGAADKIVELLTTYPLEKQYLLKAYD